MDVTLKAAAGRQVVEAYGEGGFRITGVRHDGSVIVTPTEVLPWDPDPAGPTRESLAPLLERAETLDVVLIGCGATMTLLPADLRAAFKAAGVGVEPMDTSAAARTYNVLIHEDRRVAAALIAV